jgi:hypothetical protein
MMSKVPELLRDGGACGCAPLKAVHGAADERWWGVCGANSLTACGVTMTLDG